MLELVVEEILDSMEDVPHGLGVVPRECLTIMTDYRNGLAINGNRSEELSVDHDLDRTALSELVRLDPTGDFDGVPYTMMIR